MLQKNSVFILLKQLKHNLLMEILQSQFENGTLKFSFTQKMYSPSLQFVIWKAVLAGVFCFVIFFMATGAAVCAAVHTSTDHWFRADPFLLLNLGYLSWHLTSNQIVCWYISIYFWRFNALYEKTKDQFYSAYLTVWYDQVSSGYAKCVQYLPIAISHDLWVPTKRENTESKPDGTSLWISHSMVMTRTTGCIS